jgi:hypothetical protein
MLGAVSGWVTTASGMTRAKDLDPHIYQVLGSNAPTNSRAQRPIRWRARLRVSPPVSAVLLRLPERFAGGVSGILALATSTALIAGSRRGGQTFHHLSAWLGLVRATCSSRLLSARAAAPLQVLSFHP